MGLYSLRHNAQMAQEVADMAAVEAGFLALQAEICAALAQLDGAGEFSLERIDYPGGGFGQPRVLEDGRRIEKAAVLFSHSRGSALPEAASARNPHLAGQPFEAAALSLIVHPRNPYAPATHMNLRFFRVAAKTPVWHFGGGFDLSPCYGFVEDCVHWHQCAAHAVGPYHAKMKAACDAYFRLEHRHEARGIGGLFFDDWRVGSFADSLALTLSVGNAFLPAYAPIFTKRSVADYGERERNWQLLRRGRYAEFNLAIDRGTRYGLQSGRRTESVLASLPPLVRWEYNPQAPAGSPEAELTEFYLKPRDWLAFAGQARPAQA